MKLQPNEDNNNNKSKGMFCGSGSGANNKFLDTTSYNSLGSGGNEKKENNISVYKNTNEIYEDFFNEDELINRGDVRGGFKTSDLLRKQISYQRKVFYYLTHGLTLLIY
jgi:hypothetical protein